MRGSHVPRRAFVQDRHARREWRQEQDLIRGLPREEQNFIPGLPNDIVLQHIATKVPWHAMYTLTWVSRGWRRAIQSREIYNLRKSSGFSQMMAVAPVRILVYKARKGLTSLRIVHRGFLDVDNQDLYLFPSPGSLPVASAVPLPNSSEIVQRACFESCVLHKGCYDKRFADNEGIVFLDGTLYTLQESNKFGMGDWSQEILSLDAGACEREWKHHSRSRETHPTDIWVVCNGKIYAFQTHRSRIHGKVFDPEEDEWTKIEDQPVNVCYRKRFSYLEDSHPRYYRDQVAVLGKEIYLGWNHVDNMMVFDSASKKWRTIPNTLVSEVPGRNSSSKWFSMTAIKEKKTISPDHEWKFTTLSRIPGRCRRVFAIKIISIPQA